MRVEIIISKRNILLLATVLSFFFIIAYAYAYTSGWTGTPGSPTNPPIIGHSADEMNVWDPSSSELKTLQKYVNDHGCADATVDANPYSLNVRHGPSSAFVSDNSGSSHWGAYCASGWIRTGCFLSVGTTSSNNDVRYSDNGCFSDDEEWAVSGRITLICCRGHWAT